jgi:hypothetical protein
LPLTAQATPALAPTTHVIANVTTTRGEIVRFTLLSDGSVGVDAGIPPTAAQQSTLAHESFSTPVDLFRAVAPNQQVPPALLQANARYELRRSATTKVTPNIMTQQARNGSISPLVDSWFINDYCNVPSSYNVCYAGPAYSWAYLSDSSVYYGHSIVYADNAQLLFTVSPVGQWQVPQGWTWSAWHYQSCWYGCNFAFYAGVNNARYFDFEADIDY